MNIKGSTIVLIKNGLVVAALVTQDVSASAERIGTAGATQGQWTEAITGQRNWEVNATWLLNNGGLLTDDMLQVGETGHDDVRMFLRKREQGLLHGDNLV